MKKKLLFISLVLMFGLVFSGAVSAADVYVNTTGNDATGTGTINNPYLSVSKGVSKVSTGGTVYIADGVYNGTNNRGITISKSMTIQGQSEAGTIIDAQQLNRIFTIKSTATVNIFNITLRNGAVDDTIHNLGGSIENDGNLKLKGCTLSDNFGGDSGGAIFNNNLASLTITDCTFNNNAVNTQDFGEGMGGAIINHYLMTVTGSSFNQNYADCGGAIFTSDNGNSILNNCIFTGNVAESSGGAVFIIMGTTTINNCVFNNNTALVNVGGAILNNGKANIVNSIFNGNTADSGGAIFTDGFDDDTLIVTGSIFTNNVAKQVTEFGSGAGGAISTSIGTLNFNAFFNNTADFGNTLSAFDFTVNAVKNWWGYNNDPAGDIDGPVNYSQWIVMQLSALPTIISPGETSTVTANFNHVNGGGILTGGHIPDGLSVLFESDHKGSVNPAIVFTLNGIAITTYTAGFVEGGNSIVNVTLHSQTVNTTIIIPNPVDLIPSNLVVPSNPYTMYNYKVYVDVTNDGTDATSTGFYVILKDNGNEVDRKRISSLAGKTTISGLAFDWKPASPGSHILEVLVDPENEVIEFNETNNAINTTRNVFTITQLIVDPVNCYTNDQVTLTAKLMDTAYNIPLSGKTVNFKVNNVFVNSAVTDANGVASLAYNVAFYPNTYTIFAEFVQDSLYLGSDDTDYLDVRFTPTNVTVNLVEGYWNDTVNLQATLTDTGHNRPLQNKEVNFKVNGEDIGSTFTNEFGVATKPYRIPLNSGNYPIVVTFTQDLIYLGTTNTTSLNVKSTPTKIIVNQATGYWDDTVTITATLTDTAPGHNNKPLQGKTIHFTIQGDPNTYHVITNATGTASIQYKITQNTGLYTITATHDTDQIYTGTTGTNTLTVQSTPTQITITPKEGYWNDTIQLQATLTDTHNNKPLQNKEIHFKVNGNDIGSTYTNTAGTATLPYTIPLNTGTYNIIVTFNTDLIYTGTNNTTSLNVKSTPTKIIVNQATGYWDDTVTITATLTDTAPGHNNKPLQGKTIHFTIQGDPNTYHAITNTFGTATIQYKITQNTGPYTITATLNTDQIYTGTTGTNTLTVQSTPTQITITPKEGYWNDTIQLQATLTDTHNNKPLQNKEIHFKVNGNDIGSTYTNQYGIATKPYHIPLNTGNYNIIVTFNTDQIYTGTTNNNTLNVQNTPTKIVVNPVSGYNQETVILTATLTDTVHNVPIEGKTIQFFVNSISAGVATTTNSGITTISYTINLAAGNYTIVAKFLQDNIYNASNGTNNLNVILNVTDVDPTNGTMINDIYKVITVTFSGQIQPSTKYDNIYLWDNMYNCPKAMTKTINNNILTLKPTTPLIDGRTYSILIPTNSIKDLTGNNLQDSLNSTFAVAVPPTITSTNPANNTITYDTTQTITITFSEKIQPSTKYDNIYLWDNMYNCPKAMTKTINNNILTLKPTTPLIDGRTYSILIPTNSIKDLTGNNLQDSLNSTFAVAVPPTITSTNPANNTITYDTTQTITITFSEKIQPSTKYDNIYLWDNMYNCPKAMTKTINNNILTLKPTTPLIDGRTYSILIPTNSIKDLTGNNLQDSLNSTFAVAVPPTITSTNPANNTITYDTTQTITITFSEKIQPSTKYDNIYLWDNMYNCPKAMTKTINNNILTLKPTTPLIDGRTYSILIPTNSIKDLTGNNLQDSLNSTFAVAVPPTITSTNPANNTITYDTTQTITITFSEKIQPSTKYDNIYLWDNMYNCPKAMTKTINNNILTLKPTTPLIDGRTYSILIPTNSIKDLTGNNLQDSLNSTFAVAVPPTITSTNPANNTITYDTTQTITITFSEKIQPSTKYDNIYLWDNMYNCPKAMTKTINNNILTLKPTTPLIDGRTYSILIPTNSIKDLTGNNLQDSLNSTFAVAVPPTITSTNPANNTITYDTTQTITITFSEKIQPSTKYDNIYLWDNMYNCPKAMTKTINNNILTLKPTTPLIDGRTYSILIPTNSIKDLTGNNLQDSLNSTFAVAVPPTITSTNPANNTITYDTTQTITITFSEKIQPSTKYDNIYLWDNMYNCPKAMTKTINNNILTLKPTTPLIDGRTYSILIPTNSIKDLTGNNLQDSLNSTFAVDVLS